MNGEKISNSFYEKEFLLSKLQMNYYPESDIHINRKVKVTLGLRNYATKKELGDATGFNISNLAARKDFIALKAELDNIDIHKLVNAPSSLNNLKTKVDTLDVDKLRFVHIDLKKISDRVSKNVIERKKYNKLILIANKLEEKILDTSTLIHINQYKKD